MAVLNHNYFVYPHSVSADDRHRNEAYLPGTVCTLIKLTVPIQSEAFPLHFVLADHFQCYTAAGTYMLDRTSFSS